MTVSLRSTSPSIMVSLFNSLSQIVEEAFFVFDEDGLSIDALDKSHIMFVSIRIPTSGFDSFRKEEAIKVGLDTNELASILKRLKRDDDLTMEVTPHKVNFIMEGEALRRFNLNTISMDYETPAPPNLSYDNIMTVPGDVLEDMLKDVEQFSDKITFKVAQDKFLARGQGEFGSAESEYILDDNYTETQSIFTVEYVKKILKAIKFSDDTILEIGADMPLHIIFKNHSIGSKIEFLLAPRIEMDDDDDY